jgi:hypothetical protein
MVALALAQLIDLGLTVAVILGVAIYFTVRANRGTSIKCAKCGHRHEGTNCAQCACRANEFVYPSAGSGLP